MKFTLNWLKQHLQTDLNYYEIANLLSNIGIEVEEVQDLSAIYSQFKVAEIREVSPHPDADKLNLCRVFNGEEELSIVCGANNVRKGLKVVLAPIGSVIPSNQLKIKHSKIRGIESSGMLCAAEELGIEYESDGIMELSSGAKVGESFAIAYGLNDVIFHINITPNRGDCASVRGIARDLSAARAGELRAEDAPNINQLQDSSFKYSFEGVESECHQLYFRYIANVKNANMPPLSIAQRLKLVDVGYNTALVDISNYTMLDLGRPNHIYDADKIKGEVTIRKSRENESFLALNGIEYTLPKGLMVIADSEKVLSIAGVIGGELSKVDIDTKNILVELGCFDPISVLKAGNALNIYTDARFRFERRVDYGNSSLFMDTITDLILGYCQGVPHNVVKLLDSKPNYRTHVTWNIEKFREITADYIDNQDALNILNNLGFEQDQNQLLIPSWRQGEIEIEEDLIEEVARIRGYDNIPEKELAIAHEKCSESTQIFERRIRRLIADRGFDEIISWSFTSSADLEKLLGQQSENLIILNPISSQLDVMRPTLIANLLEIITKNQMRGLNNFSVFEIGDVYGKPENGMPYRAACGMRVGKLNYRSPHRDEQAVDFYHIKADLFSMISELGFDPERLIIDRKAPRYYHPGRSACLKLGRKIVAYLGEIHPKVAADYELKGPILAFELFLQELPVKIKNKKAPLQLSQLQGVTRDFAFIIDKDQDSLSLVKAVKSVNKQLIDDVRVFDAHTLEEGKKSIALSIAIQPKRKTLTDSEIEEVSSNIIQTVQAQCKAELREG